MVGAWERILVGAAKLNQISLIVSFILLESGGGGKRGRSFFRSSDSTPSSCTDKHEWKTIWETKTQTKRIRAQKAINYTWTTTENLFVRVWIVVGFRSRALHIIGQVIIRYISAVATSSLRTTRTVWFWDSIPDTAVGPTHHPKSTVEHGSWLPPT